MRRGLAGMGSIDWMLYGSGFAGGIGAALVASGDYTGCWSLLAAVGLNLWWRFASERLRTGRESGTSPASPGSTFSPASLDQCVTAPFKELVRVAPEFAYRLAEGYAAEEWLKKRWTH